MYYLSGGSYLGILREKTAEIFRTDYHSLLVRPNLTLNFLGQMGLKLLSNDDEIAVFGLMDGNAEAHVTPKPRWRYIFKRHHSPERLAA